MNQLKKHEFLFRNISSLNGVGIKTKKSAATTALGKEGVLHGSKTLLMQNDDGSYYYYILLTKI